MNILDELVAKGVSGEVIVAVAKLIADAQQNQERRAKNTERMRAVRTRAHTGVHTETHKPASLSTIPSLTKTSVEKRKKERGTHLPNDWQPDADDCAYATDHGLDPKTLAIDFRDYWRARAGPGAIKRDWKLTWQRWCRTEKKGNGNGRAGRPAPKDDPKSIRGAFDRLAERFGPGWEDEARELSRQANLRLIQGRSGE